jgi:hypothetical protein
MKRIGIKNANKILFEVTFFISLTLVELIRD